MKLSDKIALKLLESEKLAQAKIYPTGSKVKRGSLVQALVQILMMNMNISWLK